MPRATPAAIRRIKLYDRIARGVIVFGGVIVIASVVAILVLILGVTLPLFWPGRADQLARTALPGEICAEEVRSVGVNLTTGEHPLVAHLVGQNGVFTFLDMETGERLGEHRISPPEGSAAKVLSGVERHAGEAVVREARRSPTREVRSRYSMLWSDGSVSLVDVFVKAEFGPQGRRHTKYGVETLASFSFDQPNQPLRAIARWVEKGTEAVPISIATCVRLLPGNGLRVERQTLTQNLLGQKTTSSQDGVIDAAELGPITVITMDRDGSVLYAGTEDGQIGRWHLDEDCLVTDKEITPAFDDGRAITALTMVLGDFSLAVGDSEGQLTTWFPVRSEGGSRLTRIHNLEPHAGPVREILSSTRNKMLLSLGDGGSAHLDHTTSERHLLALDRRDEPIERIGQSPSGDAVIGIVGDELVAWSIDVPHPEVSWRTLFGPTWYEGYDEPGYTWQSTGSQDSEPKLSLVPLLFGTIKGTCYAMLFAVPLALFAAAYTSHFTTPAFKSAIKPVVEIMAAIPSVVIGFLAALWLAPILHRWLLAVFISMATVPLVFLLFMLVWQALRPFDWAKRVEHGYEFLVLAPVIAAGVLLAVLVAVPLERHLLADYGGDFKLWLSQVMDIRVDPRNSVVIAFGLGFAVIPIIFSIAEDSLSSVPHSFTAASMALGGSRWQTMWRVILPSASPGIFAGIMIGLGRAVGETMIVLMATGNTPVLDWGPFNGMRTLSANIAVEIIEAPKGETLYRVLFLCAVLLFLLTFAINTAAELVRQRLRKRFGQY